MSFNLVYQLSRMMLHHNVDQLYKLCVCGFTKPFHGQIQLHVHCTLVYIFYINMSRQHPKIIMLQLWLPYTIAGCFCVFCDTEPFYEYLNHENLLSYMRWRLSNIDRKKFWLTNIDQKTKISCYMVQCSYFNYTYMYFVFAV